MNKQRLFVTSCLSIGTAAMVFAIRGDVAGAVRTAFHITNEQMGTMLSPAFWAFTIAIFISGNLVDVVGMRVLHALSAAGFIAGVSLIIVAPRPDAPLPSLMDHPGTVLLFTGFFLFGLSHGLVEGVINPLMASIYSDEKTKRIIAVHAWWPGGLMVGGLAALALAAVFDAAWQVRLSLILIPAVVYLAMALSLDYPQTERALSQVSTADMWKQATRPLFIVLFICMWMTAAVEMGPDQWFPTVMGELVPQLNPGRGSGVLFLVYTAGLMFALRAWASGLSHKSPLATLIVSSILAGVGLYWLGSLDKTSGAVVALVAATLFGIGKTFLWPTMLGITAEQFPRGGALLLSLMGGAGMLSVGLVLPIMGERMDQFGPGAALQMVALLGAVLAVIFSGVWIYFRNRGGYRAVPISDDQRHRSEGLLALPSRHGPA
jgi:MFS family permease